MGNCSDHSAFKPCWYNAYSLTVAGPLWVTLWPALVAMGFTDAGSEILDWSNSKVEEYFKQQCAPFLNCSYPDRSDADASESTDDEDLYGYQTDDYQTGQTVDYDADLDGDADADADLGLVPPPDTDTEVSSEELPEPTLDTPLYEYWRIGYLTATTDSNGLVLDNNFNLNYGTYIYLDADGNIYDAATFKGNVATRDDVTIEVDPTAVNSNLDTGMLTDEELSGISSFKIEETLLGTAEGEYFIVGWAYGDTDRPSFAYAIIKDRGDGDEYTIEYNGDKGSIKDTYKLATGINGFKSGLEGFVVDIVNSVIGTIPSITEPVLNFKKVKKKKISTKDLSAFGQLRTGVGVGIVAATATTAADTSTTATTGPTAPSPAPTATSADATYSPVVTFGTTLP